MHALARQPAAMPGLFMLRPTDDQPMARYRLMRWRAPGEREALAAFYAGLDSAARRARFHGGVSDWALAARCQALDPARALVVEHWRDDVLAAALEVHAGPRGWLRSEMALCCGADARSHDVRAHLVQIALFEAAARGCRRLVCVLDDEAAPILRKLDAWREDDAAVLDIAGYGPPEE